MPQHMSFSATINPMVARTKTRTRRDPNTWANLKPHDPVFAVDKVMGLKPGQKRRLLGRLTIKDNQIEPVGLVLDEPPELEGFNTHQEFITTWETLTGRKFDPDELCRRIDFVHELWAVGGPGHPGQNWPDSSYFFHDLYWSQLGYISPTGPVFDATYGRGVFWKRFDHPDLSTNDLDPARRTGIRWDWTTPCPTGLRSRFETSVIDPPYKLAGRPEIMIDRYGIDELTPNGQRIAAIMFGVLNVGETVTVGGHLIVKCQNQVAGGKLNDQPRLVTDELERRKWAPVDRFDVWYRPITQPLDRGMQQHSRRNHSTYLVFKRTNATTMLTGS